MIGFIKKDLAMIKSNFKLLFILIVFYAVMGISGEMDISFILPFISVMIMVSTFSYDNYNKWDAYSITLPNGRANNVKAKYIVTLLLILLVAFITLVLSITISFIKEETINYIIILLNMVSTVSATLFVLGIMYPIIYKFGIEKARITIFVIIFGLAFIGGILLNFIDMESILNSLSFLENYLLLIIVLISIITVYISYKISLKIQSKKEY